MKDTALQTTTNKALQVSNLESLISEFILSQDVKPNSRRLYLRTLRQYFNWVGEEELALSEIKRKHILQYKDALLEGGKSSLTVGSYLTVVRKFYEWTEANKYYPNVAKGVKTPKRKKGFNKDVLTVEQINQLLGAVREKGLRDFAIINLLVRTGLRTIEVTRANIGDIGNIAGERVLKVQGKGRDEKDDFVILTDKAYEPIKEYLKTRGRTSLQEPLFTSTSNNSKGGRLSTKLISKLAKDTFREIGIDSRRVTAHSLRHTAGVNVLRAGGDLYATQLFMRHADPSTTQIYLKTIEEEHRIKNAPEKLLDNIF